ncbi:MAG TPA: hypothetical protein VNT58_04000, partial [Gaiellaceae bacterium]|nr:hypothetical protein [Gaiellaceae bacterium]
SAARRASAGERVAGLPFALSIGAYALLNALIGYLLLHRVDEGLPWLAAYAFAMALHFAVNDGSLRSHHRHAYDDVGRWVVAAAIVGGAAVGAVVQLHEAVLGLLLSFVAGGVVLNVLKEELPAERKSRFLPFAGAAAAYAALLLLVE